MEWISVKNRRPLFGIQHRYLFLNGKKEVTLGYAYADDENGLGVWDTGSEASIWINDFDRQTNEIVTHWMPLPAPPKDV